LEDVFDGEFVAFGDDGLPSFGRLSRRVLHGDTRIDPCALARLARARRCSSFVVSTSRGGPSG